MSSEHHHQLVEINPQCWPQLMQLFSRNWPKHILGYSIVRNFIEWMKKCGRRDIRNLKFYSLDGDWLSDGTFIVIDRYQLFLYSLIEDSASNDQTRLEIALGLLDWSNGFKVSSFSSKHRRSVLRVVESRRLEKEFDSQTIFYYLPRQKAEELPLLPVPHDVTVRPLTAADVEIADSLWPNRHSGSLFFLRRICKWNPNLGAYKRLANGTDVLMGWCFTLQSGAMGALQVREEYQGMGIGLLITVEMARLYMHQNQDSMAFVGPLNVSSRKIFERLQFQQIDTIYWLRTFPVGKSVSTWNGDLEGDL